MAQLTKAQNAFPSGAEYDAVSINMEEAAPGNEPQIQADSSKKSESGCCCACTIARRVYNIVYPGVPPSRVASITSVSIVVGGLIGAFLAAVLGGPSLSQDADVDDYLKLFSYSAAVGALVLTVFLNAALCIDSHTNCTENSGRRAASGSNRRSGLLNNAEPAAGNNVLSSLAG